MNIQLFSAAMFLLGMAGTAATGWAEERELYSNPFNYCRIIADIDVPDNRYIGADPHPRIAAETEKITGRKVQPSTASVVTGQLQWRCMNRRLYACLPSDELSCRETPDSSRTPNDAMGGYCIERPEADKIPAFITGRGTLYHWYCKAGKPRIKRQTGHIDSRGFLSSPWHEVKELLPPGKTAAPAKIKQKKRR